MKKIFYLLLSAVFVCGLVACEDEAAKKPGDFNLKATLELIPKITGMRGFAEELKVAHIKDTTWTYPSISKDTLKNEKGEPVLGEDGKLQVKSDTAWVKGKVMGRMYEYEPVTLPCEADTFTITLKSNARWKAPVPLTGGKIQWYYNYNLLTGSTSTSGGGDGHVYFRVTLNKYYQRAVEAVQDIYTSDSTVLVRLHFTQLGKRNK